MANAHDAFQKCTELNPEAVRATVRKTKLKELLDSGIHSSAPVTAEMIEPPLDHVSHTLPERRDNLSLILNPKEVKAAGSGRGTLHHRRPARSTVTVWNCVSQTCAAGRYTCESGANSKINRRATVEQGPCCIVRLRYAPPAATNVVLGTMFTVLQSPAGKFFQVRIRKYGFQDNTSQLPHFRQRILSRCMAKVHGESWHTHSTDRLPGCSQI